MSTTIGGVQTGDLTSGFNTPFVRHTPFNRKSLALDTVLVAADDEDSLDVLTDLTKYRWSAHSVSPLFTWSNRETKLKRYARRMAEFLAQALLIEKADCFEVKYELEPSLVFNKNDEPAVRVLVNLIGQEDVRKRVFTGYLLSWGSAFYEKPVELDGVTFLPVLICTGSKRVEKQVCQSLQNIHDCVVTPVHLRTVDLKELGMALLSIMEEDEETVTASYTIPQQAERGILSLEIPTALTTKLSSLIHARCGKECTLDDVALFWDEISDQVNDVFSVQVKYCELVQLQLPKASITANTFKANDVHFMHVILLFLTSKLVLIESAVPGLGRE